MPKALDEGNGALLQPVDKNLVDQLWASSRPPLPKSDLIILREEFSGELLLAVSLGWQYTYASG